MATRDREFAYAPTLSPFPEGWYFVASRQAVLKAKLIQKTWMGENVVVWCDDDGRVCVAEAYCPHLGSDLGPDAGGRICAGRLVCPFHGYEFDATGQCVATPFADPPKAAQLRVFETREVLGLIFAWWGIGGRPPQWSLPPDPPNQAGWSDFEIWTTRFPGHPQETTENSVDLAHLRYVHGYENVNPVGQASVDGPCLESRFDFRRTRTIARIASLTFEISASTRVFGLGYSFAEVREHSIGHGHAAVGTGDTCGRCADRPVADVAGVGDTQPEAMVCGPGVSPAEAARLHHEQIPRRSATPGRSAGCGYLEPQAVRVPPASLLFRRQDHALSSLLRPVLSRSARFSGPATRHSRRGVTMNVLACYEPMETRRGRALGLLGNRGHGSPRSRMEG